MASLVSRTVVLGWQNRYLVNPEQVVAPGGGGGAENGAGAAQLAASAGQDCHPRLLGGAAHSGVGAEAGVAPGTDPVM
jgi:hypothetical protein